MSIYIDGILNHKNKKWRQFAGMCLMYGIKYGYSVDQIKEYVFETFHGLSIEEIACFFEDHRNLGTDMKMYFDGKEE